jgi:hypothetical protein
LADGDSEEGDGLTALRQRATTPNAVDLPTKSLRFTPEAQCSMLSRV